VRVARASKALACFVKLIDWCKEFGNGFGFSRPRPCYAPTIYTTVATTVDSGSWRSVTPHNDTRCGALWPFLEATCNDLFALSSQLHLFNPRITDPRPKVWNLASSIRSFFKAYFPLPKSLPTSRIFLLLRQLPPSLPHRVRAPSI
jgi:hypothetical protein